MAFDEYIIGIDASRNRSGGAKIHLIGILNELIPEEYGIKEIHVWSYPELLSSLPKKNWLIKHSPTELSKSVIMQLLWQKFTFPKELKNNKCNLVLNTDGGTVCKYKPSITMSRDMLSYEPGEMDRYKYGKSWLRLLLLKYIQNASFRTSTGVIFLTNYAASVIQQSCGTLKQISIIPHGVSKEFSTQKLLSRWPENITNSEIKCVYVSNTAPYKHQWMVIEAIKKLRIQGYNITLTLVGAEGRAHYLVEEALVNFDGAEFVTFLGHVDTNKLPKIIANFNIFIFASSCENMPNTLVEAMSVGLPIACSNRGPMPEVLGDGGVYFDPENIESIQQSIKIIVLNKHLREQIAFKAKEKSSQYSWKRCANETFSFVIKVLKDNNQ